jgi:hypothetical protein|tara:strand:- start:37 stop:222 length:186 start_codon:yes stop_codon:yes gene_type:complete
MPIINQIGVSMLKIKVTKLDKNGKIQKYTMKLRNTNSNNLELEKLAELAEDCYVDQSESWR